MAYSTRLSQLQEGLKNIKKYVESQFRSLESELSTMNKNSDSQFKSLEIEMVALKRQLISLVVTLQQ